MRCHLACEPVGLIESFSLEKLRNDDIRSINFTTVLKLGCWVVGLCKRFDNEINRKVRRVRRKSRSESLKKRSHPGTIPEEKKGGRENFNAPHPTRSLLFWPKIEVIPTGYRQSLPPEGFPTFTYRTSGTAAEKLRATNFYTIFSRHSRHALEAKLFKNTDRHRGSSRTSLQPR